MTLNSTIKKSIGFLPIIIHFKDRKRLSRIFLEIIRLTLRNRSIPDYYFTRHLYRKEVRNIEDYLPNKLLYRISTALNDPHETYVLKNKLFFDLFYGKHISNLPKLLMYNHQKMFYAENRRLFIDTPKRFESLLKDTILPKTSTESIFVKKSCDSYGGKNIYKLTLTDFPMESTKLSEIFTKIATSSFLFQDVIVQHPLLNKLNPYCINSIRMDSFIDWEGNCEIISAYIRMSLGGSHVDNISSGGCFVGIDMDTGELYERGYSSITVAGGVILTEHPISRTTFKGFRIPYFKEAKELVLYAARLVPTLRLIGWDVAITGEGPVLIEGNCGYDITNNDLISGGYKANPIFKKVLKEFHKITSNDN